MAQRNVRADHGSHGVERLQQELRFPIEMNRAFGLLISEEPLILGVSADWRLHLRADVDKTETLAREANQQNTVATTISAGQILCRNTSSQCGNI